MKNLKYLVLSLLLMSGLLLGVFTRGVSATEDLLTNPPHDVNVYFFWGDGCPHCAKEKPVLQEAANSSDNVHLYSYEIYYNSENQELLKKVAAKLDTKASGVPFTVIGDKVFVGYSESLKDPILDRIGFCSIDDGCPDSIADVVGVEGGSAASGNIEPSDSDSNNIIDLPLVGSVNVKDFSLPILTVVIAALDGFNPCAMWTLLFLISLLLGMKSRKRMWALGGSFIAASAFVYFLFMTAWLNIFLFIGYVAWVKILIGLVALAAGGYYLRDFWKNRNGACKVTGNEKRKAIFEKIKNITHNKSFWLALGGIILLAFAVNLVELVCSAGLPAVYTSILSSSGLEPWQYYGYLFLYILIFMADDLFVFFVAMMTMKVVGVNTKFGRYSHLFGGILMLILGILLIFAPQLLMFG